MKRTLLFYIILLFAINALGQNTIEKSNDIIIILGRKYYLHTVKEGETIYSLSNVYGISKEEILLTNKEAVDNLTIGAGLRIPLIDENYKPAPIKQIVIKEYIVKKKESLYSIAKKFGTTQDEIIKHNQHIQNGIKKGTKLQIPVEENIRIDASDKFFKYYQVKKGDNLQLISSAYGISQATLKDYNEDIITIKEGDVLTIPIKTLSEAQKSILKYNKNLTPDFLNIDPNYFEDPNYPPCTDFVYDEKTIFKIAFLLPFFTEKNYNLSYSAISKPQTTHYYKNTKIFYDYLQGALLAVNKLRKEGLNLEIHFFDTKGDSMTTQSILSKYEMSKMDLIFGPVYSSNFDLVDNFASNNRINIVSPFSSRTSIIKNNPFVYKVVPSNDKVTKYMASYIANYLDSCSVFVVTTADSLQKSLADTFKNELAILSKYPDQLDVKSIEFSKFITPYRASLLPQKHNIVFLPTTNEIELAAILNNLNSLVAVKDYKITVYTMPFVAFSSKLQSDWLSNLNIHYVTSIYKDTQNWDCTEFKNIYHSKFGNYPSLYSFRGYDITYYFITALKQYGKYFQFCLGDNDEFMQNGVFMKFDFDRLNQTSGFENNCQYLMYYTKDLNLEVDTIPPVFTQKK